MDPEEEARQKAEADKQAEEAARKAGEEAAAQGASQAEVNAAIEKARKEEKDKLYPQIDALKASVEQIQQALREEREEKDKIKREAEEEKERQRLAKLSDTEQQLEAIRRIEEQLRLEREERQRLEKQVEDRQRYQELEAYRRTLVEAAKDQIIPDLVQGGSKEEIDASFAIAKARYAELAERFKNEFGEQVKGRMPKSTNPDTAALEEQDLEEQLEFDAVKFRNDPDYRDKIKSQLESAYARQNGR